MQRGLILNARGWQVQTDKDGIYSNYSGAIIDTSARDLRSDEILITEDQLNEAMRAPYTALKADKEGL